MKNRILLLTMLLLFLKTFSYSQFTCSHIAANVAFSNRGANSFKGNTGPNAGSIIASGFNTGKFMGNPPSKGMSTTAIGISAFSLFGHDEYFVNSFSYFGANDTKVPTQMGDVFSFQWAMNCNFGSRSKGLGKSTDFRPSNLLRNENGLVSQP